MHPCAREKVGQLLYLASVGLVGIRRTTMGKRICSQDTTKQESELETRQTWRRGTIGTIYWYRGFPPSASPECCLPCGGCSLLQQCLLYTCCLLIHSYRRIFRGIRRLLCFVDEYYNIPISRATTGVLLLFLSFVCIHSCDRYSLFLTSMAWLRGS